jgi:pyruvate kinase
LPKFNLANSLFYTTGYELARTSTFLYTVHSLKTVHMTTIQKRTKIVATIGPRTESVEMMQKLVTAGLDVIRLNMSHGDHQEHGARIVNAKQVSRDMGVPLPILLDLSGPKIRTGEYTTDKIVIGNGAQIILTSEKIVGDEKRIYINYEKLPQEVKKGSIIMLDDGKKKLVVKKVVGTEIYCTVLVGGELKPRRGVNVPGAYLSVSSITDKDKKDLKFGIDAGVDIIALSFVRTAKDVHDLRKLLKKAGRVVPIITKIETQEAIDNLDEILIAADGAMVARGDLAIEVPTELVPVYQKRIIAKCNELGKPVITATQMLESMIHSPVPTRAEVSDIANAIYDGTDAVMLSEESTLGEFPVEAVTVMSNVARANELPETIPYPQIATGNSIGKSVYKTANNVRAALIVALTESGTSARLAAKFNPNVRVLALTPHAHTVKELALSSNVTPLLIDKIHTIDEALSAVPRIVLAGKYAKKGDRVVVTAGVPFGVEGSTNMLFVIVI